MITSVIVGWGLNQAMREASVQAATALGVELDWVDEKIVTTHTRITDYLVARQPLLVLVEMNTARGWLEIVTAIKTSPATRKIPILAIVLAIGDASDDAAQRARKAGCDAGRTSCCTC